MRSNSFLSFDESLGALAQQLKTSACKGNDFAFAVLVVFVVGFDIAFGNVGDHINYLVGFANVLHQLLVFRFE